MKPYKVLHIEDKPLAQDLIGMIIDLELGLDHYPCCSSLEAIDILKKDRSYDLIVMGYPFSGPLEELISFLNTEGFQIPILFTCDDKDLSEVNKLMAYHPWSTRASYQQPSQIIKGCIQKLLRIKERAERRLEKYCKISIRLFKNVKSIPYDLYVKINDDKFVKIYSRSGDLEAVNLSRYEEKGVNSLWIQSYDYAELSKLLFQNLQKGFSLEKAEEGSLVAMASFAQSSVLQCIGQMGLSESSLELTNQNIEIIMEICKKDPDVYSLLSKFSGSQDYLSDHCLMIACVANAISEQLEELRGGQTFLKLTCAALFHDIMVKDSEMAQLRTIDEENLSFFDRTSIEKYKGHPMQAVDFVSKIQNLPPDLEVIIRTHHERPNGNGFPRGLDYKKISLICAVFNVAEEIVDNIFHSGLDRYNIIDILEEMDAEFSKGNFKKVMEVVKLLFGFPAMPGEIKQVA